jgi:hypothetical protein
MFCCLSDLRAGEVPLEYEDLYVELHNQLDAFHALIDENWHGSIWPVIFSSSLLGANDHLGSQLLESDHYAALLLELDGLKALGVRGIGISIGFPMLHRDFHAWNGAPEEYQQYLDFYKQIASDVRSRGMKLIIGNQVLFSEGGFTEWDVRSYYDNLDLEQYMNGRKEVARTIARELKPDYLSVIKEPDTEAMQSGKDVGSPERSVELLNLILSGLEDVRETGLSVGAGIGTWQKDYLSYIRAFALVPIDFIDIHVYPVNLDFLERAVEIAELASDYGKKVGMTENWLYKIRESELGFPQFTPEKIYARDAFGFWAPLDSYFLEVMVKYSHYKHLAFMSPFWSGYFRSYIEYGDETKVLPQAELHERVHSAQSDAVLMGVFTETGLSYESAILGEADRIPPSSPKALTAVLASPSSVFLEWDPAEDNVGTAGYEIVRDGIQLAVTAQTFYLDEDLTEGTTFTYTVLAFDAPQNVSLPATSVVASTPDMTPPTMPTNLKALALSASRIDLTWSPSEDNVAVSGYKIYCGLEANRLSLIDFVTEVAFSHLGLPPNVTMFYSVEALDGFGNHSGGCPPVSATTVGDESLPIAPTNLRLWQFGD